MNLFFYDAVTCSAVCVTMEGLCADAVAAQGIKFLLVCPMRCLYKSVCCQSSDGFSESCHMLSYDSGSFVPAERPWCGWIDLLCVTVCMNKYERQPLLWVCVSVKGHATLFKGWIMTLNLKPCLLNSVRGPLWCVGSLQDKVGKLGGLCFSFEIFFFSKMQNQFPVHYFLTLGELNI